jgi:hypothetical protein
MASKRGKAIQARIMQSNSAHHWRLRPEADPAYLAELARRMAAVLGLPLKVAKARVERMAISAGASRDPGDLTRWLKRGRRQEARQKP